MFDFYERCKALIIQKNKFNIRGIYEINTIGTINEDAYDLKELTDKIGAGKSEEIFEFLRRKKITNGNIRVLEFVDQGSNLFYAVFRAINESQIPQIIILAQSFHCALSDEKKSQLLLEFESLKKANEKLSFWIDNLGINYIAYLENTLRYHVLQDFSLNLPQHRDIWKAVNAWVIENYSKLSYVNRPHFCVTFTGLKRQLNDRLKYTTKKEGILYDELRRVERSFKQKNKVSPSFFNSEQSFDNIEFNADYNTYNDFFRYRKEPDYASIYPTINVLSIANGKALAEYHLYLNEQIAVNATLAKSTKSSEDLTINQKALLLHMCGFINEKGDTTNKARILAPLLSINYKDMYDALRNVNSKEIKSDKNLEAVLLFLEDNNVKEHTRSIKAELEKRRK
ncbi:MAG TPA: hypothetical protein VG738_16040 [Chitinophagaceae bacterium]|nr:hypothetical protein [Chitinophagaceae bacterium]